MEPWGFVSAFTRERLVTLATILVGIHNQARQGHNPEEGDGDWSFACRRYERTLRQLSLFAKHLATESTLPWLTVYTDGLKMTVMLGGCPIRIYRGDPSHPNARCRAVGARELTLFDPCLPGLEFSADEGRFWALAIDCNDDLEIVRVVVEQVHVDGGARYPWDVPVDFKYLPKRAREERPTAIVAFEKPADDLGPVQVGPKTDRDVRDDES